MTSSPLGPGFHTIRLRLPAGTRADASTVPVTIEARVGYAPIPSVRYAAILLSIYFE